MIRIDMLDRFYNNIKVKCFNGTKGLSEKHNARLFSNNNDYKEIL